MNAFLTIASTALAQPTDEVDYNECSDTDFNRILHQILGEMTP